MPAPPGIVANFDHPESIAHRVIIVSVLGAAIATPTCIVRLYTKRHILKNLDWDDFIIVLATINALGFSIYVGYRIHIWDCPAPKFYTLMKVGAIAGPILFNVATMLTKLSLGLFYLRISPFKISFRIAVYTVLCISVCNNLINAFGVLWVCQPIGKYWDYSITTGKCINLNHFFLASASINAGTDLALLILPIFILYKLQLPLRRKIGVALILMTGSIVCVVSLVRVEQVIHGMKVVPTDGTWGMVLNFIWLLVEMWLGIFCACLPILYTFFRTQIMGKKPKSSQEGSHTIGRDPNTGRSMPRIPDDSAYYTAHSTAIGLDQLDVERVDQRTSNDNSIRQAESTKSLLITTARCEN
ncbi:hypothetical protein OPT61_g2171 [Boeremia exigua]|uniref:Uncharacterized protein n=1 Tax=Boeremia exigua TaxID=749465 RepID=A0ACC2IMG8_9PLEO|nr:hypothetical protein OPT61_g2171 [Boeremia exigua]